MKTISINELREKLAQVKGATFVTVSALTDANARKTGNPFKAVLKLSCINGTTGADYEASVNRQQGREGGDQTFQASARKWGQRIAPALVEHKGNFYLPIQPRHTRKPIFFGQRDNGMICQVQKESIASFLPEKKSQAEAQGVEKEIIYRDIALTSIAQISINGEQYRIRRH